MFRVTDCGLYCESGDFYVDPWGPVPRAVVTHAHSDHARLGSERYLTAAPGEHLLRARLGDGARIESVPYGQTLTLNGVRVSLHPAGHILGSAQVRAEHRGEVWVVSGDYKVEPDPTCAPFEPVPCHTFITESTFGLPIFRWQPESGLAGDINSWWQSNQQRGKASVLFGHPLGKAQRLLALLDPTIGPIFTHGAVENLNTAYRAEGVTLPETTLATAADVPNWSKAMIVAPPNCNGSPWLRRFGAISTGFASGWMRIRGARRRRSVDRGFVLSDHADWPGLLSAIEATGAEQVLVTHGYRSAMVRWLESKGLEAVALETRFEGERDEQEETES